jgi:membrane-bound lytic murein transglycosylase D
MREMLGSAVRRSRKNLKAVIGALAVTLVAIIALGTWKIRTLQQEKIDIDQQILGVEAMLQEDGQSPEELEQLIARIEEYQARARELQDSVLYQLSSGGKQDAFIQAEIKTLMRDFGAETYSIPPEFTEQVQRFIEQFQERDRRNVERALGRSRADLEVMRTVFQERNLPPDLAYIVIVESAFHPQSVSTAGAAGHWQFTAETARAYGMRVDEKVDERLDLRKSTQAASRYIRDLILEFGAGTSVMLALAAYNHGPTAVRRVIRKVDDPIKQRNFWYLYRARALPVETRQYVPKIIAAIIIGRNPERFGF